MIFPVLFVIIISMNDSEHTRFYIAIDLKSFYASVECVERKLDALRTNLVVADESRTEKTICLAVSPSLKALGISGRARLFEVIQRVDEVNAMRRNALHGREFSGKSADAGELAADPSLEIDFVIACPRMALYMDYSGRVLKQYLRYVSFEDIHSYSIDEVFIDVTSYLRTYHMTARELARQMILDVQQKLKLTATAGVGTNLYLAKVAMDIRAKHIKPDEYGVRIAELDEMSYRRVLWAHTPLTDFWRVGRGLSKKLEACGIYTMGDIARCSLGRDSDFYNEDLLYKMFGVNAELLIDHAWGYEPTRISDIKAYKPKDNSIGSGQVLQEPYPYDKARLIVREMADALVLALVKKGLVTSQVVLTVGYDVVNLTDPDRRKAFKGEIKVNRYGRKVPKSAHGSQNLDGYTSSTKRIMAAVTELFERIVDPALLVRRVYLSAEHLKWESDAVQEEEQESQTVFEQLSLFGGEAGVGEMSGNRMGIKEEQQREKQMQKAILSVQEKFGKNALLRGMNFEEGGTMRERNSQIGGHRA